MDTTPYQEFAKAKLGFEFNDINLLVTALTHRSYVNEHRKTALHHNERLEFLGDAVLELVTSDFLFKNFHEPEGIMTAWRSALVRTESIGAAGHELGYEPLIRMSRGEKHGSARAHESIVADCFEAVLGATYLDQGYAAAKKIIEQHILSKTDQMIKDGSWRDPKSYLQELSQKADGVAPTYKTLKEEGPDHDKLFTVAVYVGSTKKGVGEGHSKQLAETAAAREGVKNYLEKCPELAKHPKRVKKI